MHVQKLIEEYKELLARTKGEEAARNIEVRWTGGSSVVIEEGGKRRLVDLDVFRAMVDHLRREELPKAA